MAHGEDRNEHAGQPEARALFKGSAELLAMMV
jgi:hypothetical protein